MPNEIRRELLARHWKHSHEEDSGALQVYRPADYSFPRSRGRDAFDLSADGTAVDHPIAPADGSLDQKSRWTLEDGNRLVIRDAKSGVAHRTLKIAKVTADRLEVEAE